MTFKRPAAVNSSKTMWTEPVRPLSAADLAVVRTAMAAIAPQWSVELHGICADEATLILVPEDGDDKTGPSFLISRETGGIKVDQVRWDTLTEVGVFSSVNEVVTAIGARLAFSGPAIMPGSATVH